MPRADGEVVALCRAKLNLVFEILGRRPDGYHDLATVIHPIALADEVRVRRADSGVALTTTGLPAPQGDENIIARAARRFYEIAGLPPAIEITLRKSIPPAAGLGGGSADAAGTLLALSELHGFAAGGPRLRELALELGADVPFFLGEGAALAEGVGDRLVPLPAARTSVVLAQGLPGVNTGWAYGQVAPHHYTDGVRARRAALALLRRGRIDEPWNAFAQALAGARPDLAALTATLAESVGGPAWLTGSGSCVFAFAEDEAAAQRAAETVAAMGYWSWWGQTADRPVTLMHA